MKKTIITAAMLAAATWISPKVNAEGGITSAPVSFKVSADPRTGVANPDATELAKKTQIELYSGADGQVWESLNDKESICSFTLNNLRHRALYDRKGNWRWTEKSYQGAELNEEVKSMIIEHFGDVSIQWVDEISLPSDPTNYFVVISSSKTIRRIRIVENKVDTIEEFAKN